MQRIILIMFFLLLASNTYSASFDCSKASEKIEKGVCEDHHLSKLDSDLGAIYSALIKKLNDQEKQALLNSQKEWLKTRNRNCGSISDLDECLEQFYSNRIGELNKYVGVFLPKFSSVKEMCTEIALTKGPDRHKYGDSEIEIDFQGKEVSIDINNDGIDEVAAGDLDGTAHYQNITYKSSKGVSLAIQEIERGFWGLFGKRPFKKNGMWYTLYSFDDYLEEPAFVVFTAPNNQEFSVCDFENKKSLEVNAKLSSSENKEMCNEILTDSGKLNFYKFSSPIELEDVPINPDELPYYQNGSTQGMIDYDNDGTPNHLVNLLYISSGGRGCSYQYYDDIGGNGAVLNQESNRKNLLKMQYVSSTSGVAGCANDNENKFFRRDEKVYLESLFDKRPEVKILENNTIKNICVYGYKKESNLKSVNSYPPFFQE